MAHLVGECFEQYRRLMAVVGRIEGGVHVPRDVHTCRNRNYREMLRYRIGCLVWQGSKKV